MNAGHSLSPSINLGYGQSSSLEKLVARARVSLEPIRNRRSPMVLPPQPIFAEGKSVKMCPTTTATQFTRDVGLAACSTSTLASMQHPSCR